MRLYLLYHILFLLIHLPLIAKDNSRKEFITTSDTLQYPKRDTINQAIKLKEVVVQVKRSSINNELNSSILKIKELPYELMDVKNLINLSSGIKIRQYGGGLGSESNIVINSYTGKSIRTFVDEIPIDYIGYGLGAAPNDFFENIQIYKGFIPNGISSDALGGAINFARANENKKYLHLSHETGSYSTQRSSVRIKNTVKQFYWGADIFYATSKNDYNVDIRNGEKSYKLFNNKFKQIFTEGFIGIKNTNWTDDTKMSLIYYEINKGIPFNSTMYIPYGKVRNKVKANAIGSIRYKKQINNLKIDQFGSYGVITTQYIDTVQGKYNWNGDFEPIDYNRGESIVGGSLSKKRNRNLFLRTNVSYRIAQFNTLNANIIYQNHRSTGSDRYAPKSSIDNETDVLSYPAVYKKILASLSWNSYWFSGILKNTLSVNLFNLTSKGREIDPFTAMLSDKESTNTFNRFGFQDVFRVQIDNSTNIKGGINYTSRLPDIEEIYGNYSTILANFVLQPEITTNYYIGLAIDKKTYSYGINFSYRNTRRIIQMEQLNNYWVYNNIGNVAGYNVDADFNYNICKPVSCFGNITYNNMRYSYLLSKYGNNLKHSRLRNIPFLYANLGVNAKVNNQISMTWLYSWVNAYYFTFVPKDFEKSGFAGFLGKTKYIEDPYSIIPSQNNHTFTLLYKDLFWKNFNISLEIRNVFNSKIYDNYRVQNMGRYISTKLSLIID